MNPVQCRFMLDFGLNIKTLTPNQIEANCSGIPYQALFFELVRHLSS